MVDDGLVKWISGSIAEDTRDEPRKRWIDTANRFIRATSFSNKDAKENTFTRVQLSLLCV